MQARSSAHASGIDVSRYQGNINWAQVKNAGIGFAIIKATEGSTITDPMFAANLQGAKAAGLLVGTYHFFRAMNQAEALQEYDYFMSVINKNGGLQALDIPPALDVEYDTETKVPENVSQLAAEWLQRVEQAAGTKPLIYTYPWFGNTYLQGLDQYPLWLASYSLQPPVDIDGWKNWTFLQYRSDGSVAGISGSVDMDEYEGSVEELMAAFGGYSLTTEDADKLIAILQGIYQAGLDPQEAHRLANELRKASGQPTT